MGPKRGRERSRRNGASEEVEMCARAAVILTFPVMHFSLRPDLRGEAGRRVFLGGEKGQGSDVGFMVTQARERERNGDICKCPSDTGTYERLFVASIPRVEDAGDFPESEIKARYGSRMPVLLSGKILKNQGDGRNVS